MRKLVIVVLGVVFICFGALPAAQADSLQSVLFNVNGTTYTDYSAPGMNVAGWNQTTGNGTITFTYNPGPGSYTVSSFFDNQLGLPFFNEYGGVGGAPAAGQSWEIGDSFLSSIYNDVLAGGALTNSNSLAGTTDNFLGSCVGASCNGDMAVAMAFSFLLGANEQAVITMVFSHTQPSGFYLSQTHPTDANNVNSSTLYFTSNLLIQQTGGGGNTVPEPSTLVLLSTGVLTGILRRLRR